MTPTKRVTAVFSIFFAVVLSGTGIPSAHAESGQRHPSNPPPATRQVAPGVYLVAEPPLALQRAAASQLAIGGAFAARPLEVTQVSTVRAEGVAEESAKSDEGSRPNKLAVLGTGLLIGLIAILRRLERY